MELWGENSPVGGGEFAIPSGYLSPEAKIILSPPLRIEIVDFLSGQHVFASEAVILSRQAKDPFDAGCTTNVETPNSLS